MTTSAGKAIALGASVVAHAALVLAPYGSARATPVGAPELPALEVQIEVQNETKPLPPPIEDAPLPNRDLLALASVRRVVAPTVRGRASEEPGVPVATAVAPNVPSVAPAPLATTEPPLRFTMTAIGSSGAHVGEGGEERASAHVGALGAKTAEGEDVVLPEGAVDTPARRVSGPAPVYPRDARDEGVEADVGLVLVVSRTGTVESVEVVRPAGHGLDEAARVAARGFRFSPAMKAGRVVRVRVGWTVEFRLE